MDIERYYKIHEASEYDSIDWSIAYTTPDNCRWSVDGAMFIVNYKELLQGAVYTGAEIADVLEHNYDYWNEDTSTE